MKNLYLQLKSKHQEEVNNFPMMFAFSQKQFEEGMVKLGLNPEDTDKLYSIGAGGYIRKTDSQAFSELLQRHTKEHDEQMQNADYVYQMFRYELNNHEYCYTYDLDETLVACDVTREMLTENQILSDMLEKAKHDYLESAF